MFEELKHTTDTNILNQIYNEIKIAGKHCSMLVPTDYGKYTISEVFLCINAEDIKYFYDLTDKPKYSPDTGTIFCVLTDENEVSEGVYKYAL